MVWVYGGRSKTIFLRKSIDIIVPKESVEHLDSIDLIISPTCSTNITNKMHSTHFHTKLECTYGTMHNGSEQVLFWLSFLVLYIHPVSPISPVTRQELCSNLAVVFPLLSDTSLASLQKNKQKDALLSVAVVITAAVKEIPISTSRTDN